MTTVVIDYGRGNLFSLGHALRTLGRPFLVSGDPGTLAQAERVILPGVGAFPDAMAELDRRDLVGPLQEFARSGRPILGICLGMQLLTTVSEEFGRTTGLGLIPGLVRRLPRRTSDETGSRVPNVGWRTLRFHRESRLVPATDAQVYFAHSFMVETDESEHTVASIEVNRARAAAIIQSRNVIGFQFHPEKSGVAGLGLLDAFVSAPHHLPEDVEESLP